jgi:polysaccharide export outer membrane protein
MKKYFVLCWMILASFGISSSAGAVDGTFRVLPGDILQITVWKEEGMDREVLVLPDGSISFPLIGTMAVKNKTPSQIQSSVKEKLIPFIPGASVTVAVKSPLGHKVNVLGQVQEPGEIILVKATGVMQALSQVGGLTPYADTDDIVVIRRREDGEKQVIEYPYDKIVRGRALDQDFDLKPGDVIVVPTAGLF